MLHSKPVFRYLKRNSVGDIALVDTEAQNCAPPSPLKCARDGGLTGSSAGLRGAFCTFSLSVDEGPSCAVLKIDQHLDKASSLSPSKLKDESKSKSTSKSKDDGDFSILSSPVSPNRPRPPLRQSVTGISLGDASGSLRARDQPRIVRSHSIASTATPQEITVEIGTSDFTYGGLRPHNVVKIVMERPLESRLSVLRQVGQGGFGSVWLMIDKQSGVEYAVKKIKLGGKDAEQIKQIEGEMQIFARLKHRHIVVLRKVFRDVDYLYLVMDLCLGGDVMDYLMNWWSDTQFPERGDPVRRHRCRGLPWDEVAPLLYMMLAAVGYMHHHRFCHRDVKLENFMIQAKRSRRPVLKLGDFGMSVLLRPCEELHERVGTLMYIAPEVLLGAYTEKCDIWSVGICAYILCFKMCPYGEDAAKNPELLANSIFQNCLEEWPSDTDKPPELQRLVKSLLVYEPQRRPSATEAHEGSAWLRKHGQGGNQACCSIQ